MTSLLDVSGHERIARIIADEADEISEETSSSSSNLSSAYSKVVSFNEFNKCL